MSSWVEEAAEVLAVARRGCAWDRAVVAFALKMAIQEAARRVRDTDEVPPKSHPSYYAQLGDAAATREACARAIEAMLEPQPEVKR